MDPVIETKKERKNRLERERYRKSDKFKNNIVTIPNSDDEDSSFVKKRKTSTKKKPKNNYAKSSSADNQSNAERDQAEDLALSWEVIQLEKESCSKLNSDTEDIFRGYNEYVNYDSVNYDCVETDEQVNNLLSMMEEGENLEMSTEYSSEVLKTVSDWKKKRAVRKEKWNSSRFEFSNARTSFESPAFECCSSCSTAIHHYSVFCKTCKKELCSKCDENHHSRDPFHQRIFYKAENFFSKTLQPNEYVGSNLDINIRGMPVPCFVPSVCESCGTSGTLTLEAGYNEKYVITLTGRFDVNSSKLVCMHCKFSVEFTEKQYVQSGWWPGATSGSSYLYAESLLEFWYHLDNQYFGASTKKFIATLNRMAMNDLRKDVIDITLFDKASREYQLHKHEENFAIRKQDELKCPACACDCCGDPSHVVEKPLATEDGTVLHKKQSILDGNFMVPRLASASDGDGQTLLGGKVIVPNKEVDDHISNIDAQYQPGTNTTPCGGSFFNAAKEATKKKKNYKETGLLISCCRHLVVLLAANIFCGESYRHVHFLHNELYKLGYTVFCYDVVCLYWKWAKKIGTLTDEFREKYQHLTDKMISFLPRWHGIGHVWHCYVQNIGHARKGVGATIGEEMEQVNATISRYGNKVKHMTEENRNDTLTAGLLYMNRERILRMPKFLAKRYSRARLLASAFESKLKKMLSSRNLSESALPAIAENLLKASIDCSDKQSDGEGPPSFLMTELEGIYIQFQYAQRKIDESVYKKERTHSVRQRSDAKKKASKIIDNINKWHAKAFSDDEESSDLVTMDDFLSGTFPWQHSGKKDEFKENRELIDIWRLSERYKEEIMLSESDMKSFIKSTELRIDSLTQSKVHFQSVTDERLIWAKGFIINQEIERLKKIKQDSTFIFSLSDFYDDEFDQLMTKF